MNSKAIDSIVIWLIIILFSASVTPAFAAGDIPVISMDELKEKMGSKDIVILDVRTDEHWEKAEFKIKGARRVGPDDPEWLDKYPKDNTIVLYCA